MPASMYLFRSDLVALDTLYKRNGTFWKSPTLCSVYYPRHTGTVFLKTLVLKFSSSEMTVLIFIFIFLGRQFTLQPWHKTTLQYSQIVFIMVKCNSCCWWSGSATASVKHYVPYMQTTGLLHQTESFTLLHVVYVKGKIVILVILVIQMYYASGHWSFSVLNQTMISLTFIKCCQCQNQTIKSWIML